MSKALNFETLQVHAGQEADPTTGARSVPIYQTAAYTFKSPEHAANLFALKEFGNIYTRLTNPTTDVFEQRIAALEGGVAALAVSSGSSAITYAIMNIAKTGDEIISSSNVYGGTYNLFANTLPKSGINCTFVDADNPENFAKAVTAKTKAIFFEVIGNPSGSIVDIEKVAQIAKEHNIPLIVDNTFATPYLFKPFEHGANIIVHSATKFIGGHGTTIGGVVVDGGNFDWKQANERFPDFNTPDPSYHGLVYTETFGNLAYIIKMRVQLLRNIGACISPFNSFMLLQGVETLSLRVERHTQNALKIAQYLENHGKVTWVNYAGLPSNKYHHLALKYLPKGAGSIFTFGIKGGAEAAKKFIANLKIFSLLANVADVKSLVIHPNSTTHSQLDDDQQLSAGVTPDLIRLSIGIEHVDDLIDDLETSFNSL